MNGNDKDGRQISAHPMPVSLSLPRARPSLSRTAPQATFLTQLLTAAPSPAGTQPTGGTGTQASLRYRLTEASDLRRLPAGYRKSVSA